MLDNMKYRNHIGEEIEFGKDGILINTNDFRNYEWIYNSRYKKIVNFDRDISTKTLPVIISGDDAKASANRIFEVIEKDVLSNKHGSIIINGYELKGFFYASNKPDYTRGDVIKLELLFVSDLPLWSKETAFHFNVDEAFTSGLDYNHDFAYDFTSTLYTTSLVNDNFADTEFKVIIYGKAVNPVVNINSHVYEIDTIVEEGEYLVIDSVAKEVYVITKSGAKMNAFGFRNKESYIFEPIPSGKSNVSWGSDFSFDVVLVEQRSEPKWN